VTITKGLDHHTRFSRFLRNSRYWNITWNSQILLWLKSISTSAIKSVIQEVAKHLHYNLAIMQNELERVEIELSQWLTELGLCRDGKLADIQELNLYNNHLTSLPESIGQLTNLHTLNLSGN
jgi:Leucine-rich repeat (LRR) protein